MSLRDTLKTEKAKERYDRNFNSVEITFSQKELEEHDKEIRAKAIDEFAERIKERIVSMQMAELQGEDICPCAENGKECPYINQDIGCQYCAREQTIKDIEQIAEELKESNNE